MRAALIREHGGIEKLEIADVEIPNIDEDEVLIEVKSVALNRLDVWVRNGSPALKIPLPHIGGSDFSGIIHKIGNKVTALEVGDRVVINAGLSCRKCYHCRKGEHSLCRDFKLLGEHVWGGTAEYAVAPETNVLKIPEHISFEIAAAASLTSLTVYRMLVSKVKINPGELILVLGAGGGIGTIAVQMAQHFGGRVIALTSTDAKANKLKSLGAEYVINYKENPEWGKLVWQYSEKKGVDIVVDSVGEIVWKQAIRSLKQGGRFVTCGATTGNNAEINLALLFWKQLSIFGSTMASDKEFTEAMALVFQEKISPVIDTTYPLEKIQDAHRRLESGDHMGKIVVTLSE